MRDGAPDLDGPCYLLHGMFFCPSRLGGSEFMVNDSKSLAHNSGSTASTSTLLQALKRK